MPGRTRRAQKTPLTLGITGSGELDKKALDALLDDYITEDTEVDALYVPVTKDDFTDEVENVVKWAADANIPYITISDDDAHKDRALKKVIAGGTEDFAIEDGSTAGKTIIELLAGDEENVVADGRLLIFLASEGEDGDADAALVEAADAEDVAMFDLCNGLEVITLTDEGADDEPAAEPEPEPEPEEKPRRRGRAAAAPVEAEPAGEVTESREELVKLTLVELKKKAKAADPQRHTTESLRGLQKGDVINLLLGTDPAPEAAPDEAQASLAAVPDAADEDTEADSRELVFQRLQGQREAAERITRTLVKVSAELIDAASEEGGSEAAFETAAAIAASGLMIFADFIVTEVRKPKSAGRPRKDGTEALPKAEPAPKARRRRAS